MKPVKGLALWICFAVLSGAGLFWVAQNVQSQRAQLAALNAAIEERQEEILVLETEWAYLNRPDRLQALTERVFGEKDIDVAVMQAMPVHKGAPAPQTKPIDLALALSRQEKFQ